MNDKTFVALFVALGTKLYELQTGFAAMVILNTGRGASTRDDFLEVKAQVEASQEMKKFRLLLDTLRNPKEPVDFESCCESLKDPFNRLSTSTLKSRRFVRPWIEPKRKGVGIVLGILHNLWIWRKRRCSAQTSDLRGFKWCARHDSNMRPSGS